MKRIARRIALQLLSAALVCSLPAAALCQATTPGKPGARGRTSPQASTPASAPAETRFRLVLNVAFAPSTLSYGDVRTPLAYAEPSTIRTSYEAGSAIGPDVALQVSLYRGLGIRAGYAYVSRDTTGTLDASRPHPLYLNRPRSASAELSGYGYSEGAFDVGAAFARSAGSFDWALFAGATLFQIKADLVDVATFDERYPYDELAVLSTPSRSTDDSPTGFNVGGRLDYRFGSSRRFGVGLQLIYRSATAELVANSDATPAKIDVGGLSVAGGGRLYF